MLDAVLLRGVGGGDATSLLPPRLSSSARPPGDRASALPSPYVATLGSCSEVAEWPEAGAQGVDATIAPLQEGSAAPPPTIDPRLSQLKSRTFAASTLQNNFYGNRDYTPQIFAEENQK